MSLLFRLFQVISETCFLFGWSLNPWLGNHLSCGILPSVASLAQGASLSVLFGLGNGGMPCTREYFRL